MSLIEELKKKLEPKDALIFYSCNSDVYVEHRSICDGKMGAGQPLDVGQFARMIRCAEKYAKEQTTYGSIKGAIPPNLMYASTDVDDMRLVWWRKPEERKMYFKENLGIPNGVMKVPGMLYSAEGEGLSVWCYRGSKPRGVLYHAPFFNVYDSGRVCLGNSKTDKPQNGTFEDWMLYWEKMFWQSEFASLIAGNPIEGNLVTVTKMCIKKGLPFPIELMKRSSMKLKDILQ